MISGAAIAAGTLSRSTSTPFLAAPLAPKPVPALARGAPAKSPPGLGIDAELLQKALAALDEHSHAIDERDRMAIVDFSAPSAIARLHFVNVAGGKSSQYLVAHGSGSDPEHTGFVRRFSNAFNSNASSEGAFVTQDYYVGKHGRSQRLVGLDATNNNALDRAVVIHSAWYANANVVQAHGKLGRSQGCFAVGENELDDVFGFLGSGRLLFAAQA